MYKPGAFRLYQDRYVHKNFDIFEKIILNKVFNIELKFND